MKKVTALFVLALSAISLSAAHAQTTCQKACAANEKRCLAKHTKMDFWGNKLVTPEGERACLETSQQCRKDCVMRDLR